MFAIATPQTVTLTIPGDDHPSTLINFRVNDADTSRCVLEIVTPEGDTHRLTFSVRGQLVDSNFTSHEANPEDGNEAPAPVSPIVDGRDTRAFNPYTYQPPVNADAANRTDAGYKAINVPDKVVAEQRDLREQAESDAADRAKEALDKHLGREPEYVSGYAGRSEGSEMERRGLRADNGGNANTAFTPGLDTADNPLGDQYAEVKTFPSDETQRLVAGKRMDGSPQSNPSGDPMAPAPSSPLPGSPPPHPLDQPDPGKVNTSKDLQGA